MVSQPLLGQAVVIGKTCKNVQEEQAMDFVLGYV